MMVVHYDCRSFQKPQVLTTSPKEDVKLSIGKFSHTLRDRDKFINIQRQVWSFVNVVSMVYSHGNVCTTNMRLFVAFKLER